MHGIIFCVLFLCLLLLQDLGLQPEEGFILKIVQLEELRHVRHSIFVIGNAGTGKSKVIIRIIIY